jgi:hypothetical protein
LQQYYKYIEGNVGAEDAPWLIGLLVPGSGNVKSAGGDLNPQDLMDALLIETYRQKAK